MSAPRTSFIALVCALGTAPLFAQATAAPQQPAAKSAAKSAAQPALPEGVPTPADYVIGADDQLSIVFWRDKDMTSDVGVRPDGKISLPLINEVMAAGLTPEQLRVKITEASSKFIEDPEVSVVVKQINSRRIYVTGQVGRPGPYPLSGPTTVLQMLARIGEVDAEEFRLSTGRDVLDCRDQAHRLTTERRDKGPQMGVTSNHRVLAAKMNRVVIPGLK